jgi:tRNA (guanine-N1)-methyltransferase
MFKFHVISLFPELFDVYCTTSILGRGCGVGAIKVQTYNPREFCTDKYRRVDDTPYGGGAGMVMKPEPLYAAFESIKKIDESPVILASPRGQPFTQKLAQQFSENQTKELTIICGRYEGIDERVAKLATHEISMGDFVLTGGELPALAFIDAIARLIPGVVGKAHSLVDESFGNGLFQGILEAPQYTKPPEFRGMVVPEVLRSGDHKAISNWRRQEALRITWERRSDLLDKANLSSKEKQFIDSLKKGEIDN